MEKKKQQLEFFFTKDPNGEEYVNVKTERK